MDCTFCSNNFEYAILKEYKRWSTQLFVDDQYYLGRSVIVLKNRHAVDINELKEKEREELFKKALPDLKKALSSFSSPDFYNYCSLGNGCEHFHVHVVPRYKSKRYFKQKCFEDEYFGKNYSQDYERVKLQRKDFEDLRDILKILI